MRQIMTHRKSVEGRKNSELYQKIEVGDMIILKSNNDSAVCIIEAIRKYPDIKTFLEHEIEKALPGVSNVNIGLDVYHTFISDDEIKRLNEKYGAGFIAFEIFYLYPKKK